MRANLNFLTFSQSKTVISFIILLVLQILSLSLKLNICIHKKQSLHFPCNMYHLWYDASSVASFLVLGAGGGNFLNLSYVAHTRRLYAKV